MRSAAGGGAAPRPRMGMVHAAQMDERSAMTRLRWKKSLGAIGDMVIQDGCTDLGICC